MAVRDKDRVRPHITTMRRVRAPVGPLQVIPEVEREHVRELLGQAHLQATRVAPVTKGKTLLTGNVARRRGITPLLRRRLQLVAGALVIRRETQHVVGHEVPVQPQFEVHRLFGRQAYVVVKCRIVVKRIPPLTRIDQAVAVQVRIVGRLAAPLVPIQHLEVRKLRELPVEEPDQRLRRDRV